MRGREVEGDGRARAARGVLPGEMVAVVVGPLHGEAGSLAAGAIEGEVGREGGAGGARAGLEAGAHPGEQAVRLAAVLGTVDGADGPQAAHEVGGGVAAQELTEGLAHGQAARGGEVAHQLGARPGEAEGRVAVHRPVDDHPVEAAGEGGPGGERADRHAVGPEVGRQVALQPGRDERLELRRVRAVGEHQRLAAALAAARGVEEAGDMDLGLGGGRGVGARPLGEDDEARGVAAGEALGLLEERGRLGGGGAGAEQEDEVELGGADDLVALRGPGMGERRQGLADGHGGAGQRGEEVGGHGVSVRRCARRGRGRRGGRRPRRDPTSPRRRSRALGDRRRPSPGAGACRGARRPRSRRRG